MTDRETRLRERIDRLTDERDQLRDLVRKFDLSQRVLVKRLAARDGHLNQHGPCPIRYATDEERQEARRLSWRMSKRRKRRAA